MLVYHWDPIFQKRAEGHSLTRVSFIIGEDSVQGNLIDAADNDVIRANDDARYLLVLIEMFGRKSEPTSVVAV